MRLDKYLKVSRIMKRRTVAHEASSSEKVLVNNKIAKPATNVMEGDIIQINYYNRILKIRVLSTNDHITKESAPLYEVIEEKALDPLNNDETKSSF